MASGDCVRACRFGLNPGPAVTSMPGILRDLALQMTYRGLTDGGAELVSGL